MKVDQFQNIVYETYQKMRNKDFCDVTLVSADNQKLEAHKVILSGSSNVFRNMLLGEKHHNPMIFLGGLREEKKKNPLKNSVLTLNCLEGHILSSLHLLHHPNLVLFTFLLSLLVFD